MYYTGFEMQQSKEEFEGQFPFSLPIFQQLKELRLSKPVTVFVGENGSGKSTLLESLALAMNLPAIGSASLDTDKSLDQLRPFANQLRGSWKRRVYRGFFFRAEDYFGFVKRLNALDDAFADDAADFEKNLSGYGLKLALGAVNGEKEALKRKYGDLNTVSHGEGFLKILHNRMSPEGIYLIDEPEAALSPQRQLSLYSLIKRMTEEEGCQFILATHSPILMALPNSQLFQFDEEIQEISYQDTEHFTVLKQFLNNPESFTRFL